MTAQITRLNSDYQVIPGSAHYRPTSFEHCLELDRTNGTQVEIALAHVPNVAGEGYYPPLLQLASRNIQQHPGNIMLKEHISLTMEEARLLKDFLNRPEVAAWLEEEEA